jgi:hypothetical protein
MIDEHESTSSQRARDDHRINPDIVFVRDDGWTLGAPDYLENVAFELWEEDWWFFVRKPSRVLQSIDNYF